MTSAALIVLVIGAGCRSSERQAVDASAEVAVSPAQKQLWQDAADKGAPGLERVPVPQEPVRSRERSARQSVPVPAQPVKVPAGVVNQIRILTPHPKNPSFMGKATVVAANGNQIDINLGAAGILRVLARANGRPLPIAKGDVVDVFYRVSQVPEMPDDVIAIRNDTGAGIAQMVRSADGPVELLVPLFNVNLKQENQPGLPVSVTALKGAPAFTTGQTTALDGDVRVLIVGTSRFTLNVMVWRNP